MPRLATPDESTFVPLRDVPGGKCPVSSVSHERRAACPFVSFHYLISHLLIQQWEVQVLSSLRAGCTPTSLLRNITKCYRVKVTCDDIYRAVSEFRFG